jgi:hypothetical protein
MMNGPKDHIQGIGDKPALQRKIWNKSDWDRIAKADIKMLIKSALKCKT